MSFSYKRKDLSKIVLREFTKIDVSKIHYKENKSSRLAFLQPKNCNLREVEVQLSLLNY